MLIRTGRPTSGHGGGEEQIWDPAGGRLQIGTRGDKPMRSSQAHSLSQCCDSRRGNRRARIPYRWRSNVAIAKSRSRTRAKVARRTPQYALIGRLM